MKRASFGPPLRGVVRKLIIITGAGLFFQAFFPDVARHLLLSWDGFRPWQVLTAMFCHADLLHFGFNMFALWMFGSAVEDVLGGRRFLVLYFVSGVVGNVIWLLSGLCPPSVHTLGASGGVFGILYAFCRYFPKRTILLFMVFPMKARTFAILIGAVELVGAMQSAQDGVAHALHLFGALAAAVYIEVYLGQNERIHAYLQRLRWRYKTRHITVIPGGKGDGTTEGPKAHAVYDEEDGHYHIGTDEDPFQRDDDPPDKGPTIN